MLQHLIGSHSIAQLATSAISSSADIDAASRYYHCLVRYVVTSSYDYERKRTYHHYYYYYYYYYYCAPLFPPVVVANSGSGDICFAASVSANDEMAEVASRAIN